MQALPSFLLLITSRWGRGLVGASILSALVWSFLPAIPAFAAPLPRALAIVAIFAGFGLATLILARRARARQRAVDEAVTGGDAAGATMARGGGRPGRDADDAAAGADVAALRTRLREAIATLRKRGVRSLYDLPWYVVIGPPGAGKTTALKQSGLHFPLDAEHTDPLRGVAGTRLCDWWFCEEAVLIDTAGRYTTQDSNRSVDKAGWLGFLDLLRRARPRQPLNGVLVVVALSDLLEMTQEQRDAHARAIRLRIDELTERLRIRLPIYLVLSKMDRLAGFDLFFEDLDSSARAQVWGTTFALDVGVAAFANEFRQLVARIDGRLVDRLQAERGADRRALLSGFPLQLASIEPVLTGFLSAGFSGSRIDPAPFLRGVYLTSATQTGTPFDRLTGMLARTFAIDQKRTAPPRPSQGRGYFLSRMMREVILAETPLVATAPGRYRRAKLLRLSALVGIGVLTLLGLVLIWAGDIEARVGITRQQDAFDEYRRQVAAFPAGVIDRQDQLPEVSALLDRAATLSATDGQPLAGLVALSSRSKLVAAGRIAYAGALDHLLYPRLVWRLEQQIRTHLQDPDTLYDATRVYLLLGGAGPHEPDVIRQWIEADWAVRFPGTLNATLRDHLARHLDALLATPLPAGQLPLDGALVAEARIGFSHVTPAQRIYDRLRAGDPEAVRLGWSPQLALAAAAANFAYAGGAPLDDGIPAFLTGSGFATIMRRDLPRVAHMVADESWVVGRDPGIATGGADVGALEQAVAQLWAAEAIRRWETMLSALELAPFGDRRQTQDSLYLLSSPQSPLRDMLISIVHALRIDPPPPSDPSGAVAAAWTEHWRPLFELAGMDMRAAPATGTPPAGQAPIDAILVLIQQLDNELATGSTMPAALPQVAQQSADPAQRLLAEASRQPVPVSRWLRQIAEAGGGTLGQEARSAASGAYNGPGGPDAACRALVQDHYPFQPDANTDASVAGFARVFAPGGLLDSYFQSNMAPYVDSSDTRWHTHPAGGVQPPFDDTQLVAFQRAAAIRKAFFPAGGQPALYLTLGLSAPAEIMLRLGGSTVTPGAPASLSWPGSDSLSPALLQQSGKFGPVTLLSEQGPWALFRLLGDGTADPAEGGERSVLISRGGVAATLHVGTGGDTGAQAAPGPFDPGLLAGFVCPKVP